MKDESETIGDPIDRDLAIFIVGLCSRIGNLSEEEKWKKCMEFINRLPNYGADTRKEQE